VEPIALQICHCCRLVHEDRTGGWITRKAYQEATGINPIICRLTNQGGSPQGLTNQGGASASGLGVVTGLPTGGNNPLVASPLISVSTVPEGSSLILLGAAFFTLALFGRRLQSSF
jgi:hypothetical protein